MHYSNINTYILVQVLWH